MLAQLLDINVSMLRLFWSVSVNDIGLVSDTFQRFPDLPKSAKMFITGLDKNENILSPQQQERLDFVSKSGASVHRRRLEAADLQVDGRMDEWYLCASSGLKRVVLDALNGKKVVYEDFNY